MLLQKGVLAGLTLHQIASIMTREDMDKPSELEEICAKASELVQAVADKVELSFPSEAGVLRGGDASFQT